MSTGESNLPSSPPSLIENSLGGGGSHKVKATHKTVFNSYWRKSTLRSLQFSRTCPNLWLAITKELPWCFLRYWDNGLTLSRAIYEGVKRNGPGYIDTWLNENHIQLSENGLMIVEAVRFFHSFITYETLMEFLKDHNWGELRTEKAVSLDLHPFYAKSEEPKPIIQEKKKIEEVDVVFYANKNKITNSEAFKYFQANGYEIISFKDVS